MTTDTLWRNTETLPPLFPAAAKGDAKAARSLVQALAEAEGRVLAEWPRAVRTCWQEGLTLLAESIDRHHLGEEQAELVLAVAETGFDHILLRDTIATLARKTFAKYADPAGLIAALGIYDAGTPLATVCRRWNVFAALDKGTFCCEPGRGMVGTVTEIDAIINEVIVQFGHVAEMTLPLVLTNLVLVKPGSDLDLLLHGADSWDGRLTPEEFAGMLDAALVAACDLSDNMAEMLLVPRLLSAEQYRAWKGQVKVVSGKAEVGGERAWDEARGLDELVGLMSRQKPGSARPAGFDNVREILLAAASRLDQAATFAEAFARLVDAACGQEWVKELIQSVGGVAVAWQDSDLFVSICDRMSGRLLPDWYRATIIACSPRYLARVCPAMPLRIWTHAERLLAEDLGTSHLLLEAVTHTVEAGNASADSLLWLWRTGGEPARLLASATLLFRTLAKPVRGSYLKANRDLRKLLMENEKFQRLIMKGGDPEAIASLVRCIKHLPLLDSGERQSLLVRIVRIFPEAMSQVEERRHAPTRRELDKLTSVRTFEQRRRELEEIINVKIPANSRAIGHARELGDLRENAEFKAAKDEQAYLSARRAELERDLHEIKATTFDHIVVGDVVQPGCAVELKLANGDTRTYYLLGLWDSVPEKRILSYETPLGLAMVGASLGDEVAMPVGGDAVVTAVSELPDDIKRWVRGEE
ncbi:MAG: GreA/GreB family elongation factor [Lentisphaeria bacterium]|jgi:transcription elongation GreA/GreB family factor|nr:GreA/GreB family elongation factor [Lentisphaeria bacterium]